MLIYTKFRLVTAILVLSSVIIGGCTSSSENITNGLDDDTTQNYCDTNTEIEILNLSTDVEVSVTFKLPAICCHAVFVEWWHESQLFDSWESSYEFVNQGYVESVTMKKPFPKGQYELKIFIGIVEKVKIGFEIN